MVLVCVTNFKSQHKIQSRWENREYVVEWQPYPNLPVHIVHPIDGEGHSHALHWNFLFPLSHSLEQEEGKNAVERAISNEPILVSQEEDALLANHPTQSQLESIPCLPSKQCELVDPELTGLPSTDSMEEGLQANDDAPAPLR